MDKIIPLEVKNIRILSIYKFHMRKYISEQI